MILLGMERDTKKLVKLALTGLQGLCFGTAAGAGLSIVANLLGLSGMELPQVVEAIASNPVGMAITGGSGGALFGMLKGARDAYQARPQEGTNEQGM